MMKNFSSWLTNQKRIWKEKDKKEQPSFDRVSHHELKSVIQIVP
jgi:hypothetical protein